MFISSLFDPIVSSLSCRVHHSLASTHKCLLSLVQHPVSVLVQLSRWDLGISGPFTFGVLVDGSIQTFRISHVFGTSIG